MLYKFRIILKSGAEVIIIARDLKVSINNFTQEFVGYSFTGIKGAIPLHINVSEIAAVIQEDVENG